MSARRQKNGWRWRAPLAASGALLAGALAGRHALEASMAAHMLLQIPAIFVAGVLAARAVAAWRQGRQGWLPWIDAVLPRLRRYDEHGVPGLLALSFLLAYWMIPKALEQALAAPAAEALKFVSLFGGGLLLAGCLARANRVIQLFFVGNAAWMTAIVGLLYQDTPARLCNAYLLDDQLRAGQGLVLLSVAVPALWLWHQLRDYQGRRQPV